MSIKHTYDQLTEKIPFKPLDILLFLLFALAIGKLISLNLSTGFDDGDWERFKTEHHCKLKISADGTESSTWVCDNGKVYYGWRQQK